MRNLVELVFDVDVLVVYSWENLVTLCEGIQRNNSRVDASGIRDGFVLGKWNGHDAPFPAPRRGL